MSEVKSYGIFRLGGVEFERAMLACHILFPITNEIMRSLYFPLSLSLSLSLCICLSILCVCVCVCRYNRLKCGKFVFRVENLLLTIQMVAQHSLQKIHREKKQS